MDHCGAVPENGDIIPGQRGGDDGDMNEQRRGRMAKVEECQVEEVDNQQQLALPEVTSDP